MNEEVTGGYDVVVIGAGPAGITIARELGHKNISVCLIEAGGEKEKLGSIDIESIGIKIRPSSREHVFGGASSTWGGVSKELEVRDLRSSDNPWPISKSELDFYYKKIYSQLPIPTSVINTELYKNSPFYSLKNMESLTFVAESSPVDFGKTYYKEIESLPTVEIKLNLIVTKVEIDFNRGEVQGVNCVTTSKNADKVNIKGKTYVLACGGIENARLVLDSGYKEHNEGVSMLGACFMDHPKGVMAEFEVGKKLNCSNYYWGIVNNNKSQFVGLALNDVPPGEPRPYLRLFPRYSWSGNLNIQKAIRSISEKKIIKSLYFKLNRNAVLMDESEADSDTGGEVKSFSLMRMIKEIAKYSCFRFLPFTPRIQTVVVRVVVESLPNKSNRIELSKRKDSYGRSIPKITYHLGIQERNAIDKLLNVFESSLKESGFGVLQKNYTRGQEEECLVDASHHCGTTRMGVSPEKSVVDENCQFHQIKNLYAAGSSVFPTSGVANPTLTILALSLRLANYLSAKHEKK